MASASEIELARLDDQQPLLPRAPGLGYPTNSTSSLPAYQFDPQQYPPQQQQQPPQRYLSPAPQMGYPPQAAPTYGNREAPTHRPYPQRQGTSFSTLTSDVPESESSNFAGRGGVWTMIISRLGPLFCVRLFVLLILLAFISLSRSRRRVVIVLSSSHWCFALPLPYRFIHAYVWTPHHSASHITYHSHSLSLILPPPPHQWTSPSNIFLHICLEARGRDARGPRAHCCCRCCCDMESLWTLDLGLPSPFPCSVYIYIVETLGAH